LNKQEVITDIIPRVPDVETLLCLSRLICLAKVCTFNILWHKFWGCEHFWAVWLLFSPICVWWRMKVVGGRFEKGNVYRSLIRLKPNQWYKHNEIVSFTITYMFICIQSGIFPISVMGHLQMLFWLCRLCDVKCCVVDCPSWQFERGVSTAEQ